MSLDDLALFVAIRSLRTLHPQPANDIADMETLLFESYPTYAATLTRMALLNCEV